MKGTLSVVDLIALFARLIQIIREETDSETAQRVITRIDNELSEETNETTNEEDDHDA